MKISLKRLALPFIIGILIAGFWISPDFQQIAAGVAIFLFGMLMLEDGFKLFSGGFLERILEQATKSVPRSLLFGIVSTTLMQSSSLVSVITISFLSAELITLLAGVGIVFGANIGTTTGAWLVAGLGLKANISAYAMPLLAIGVVLVFQKSKYLRGAGYALAGLGFLFLGIHYMKLGFETFRDSFDLIQYALTGVLGLIVYTLVGTLATVVMQSSHATMVLIITALASGQISYENALALELRRAGLHVAQQHPVAVLYTGEVVGEYIVDLYVDRRLIIELKVAKAIDPIHLAQCINYLKATGHSVGLLMNFAKPRLEYKRLVHRHPEN